MVAYAINGNDKKVNVTILFTVNAAGSFVCPTVVYKGVRQSRDVHIPVEWHVLKTPKGWMTCDAFLNFLRHIFLPYIETNNVKRPVILFLDGHVSHISLPASKFCQAFGIVLVCFLPAATHVIQLLDKAVFKSMKSFWRVVVDHFRFMKKREVTKLDDVPSLMNDVLHMYKAELHAPILSGFRSCGLYPWSTDAIKYDIKCKYAEKVWWAMKDEEVEKEMQQLTQPREEVNPSAESSIASSLLTDFPTTASFEHAKG